MLPAELPKDAQQHSRYKVKAVGTKLVVEPEAIAERPQKAYEECKQGWDALTDEITAAWNTDQSAAEIIAEMRC